MEACIDMTTELSFPTSTGMLVDSIETIMRPHDACTATLQPGAGGVRRLGLALDSWSGLSRWAFEQRLDGLFLHRYRSLQSEALARRLAVVANHDAFDRRFGFGDNAELHALLKVNPFETLGFRDGLPLGTVSAGVPRPSESLRALLVAAFGGVDEELPPERPRRIARVAVARAMTAELVRTAATLGADAYVTGQIRHPARAAAAATGLHVFGVGHRRSEEWALQRLAALLCARWPGLEVRVRRECSARKPLTGSTRAS